MKFRIIERKKDNGESYYLIQSRFLWIWWSCLIGKILELSDNKVFIRHHIILFKDIEDAKATLERIRPLYYNHRGITIYPTVDANMFYTSYGAEWKDCHCYINLIHGSYEECCQQIDELLRAKENAKKNRKYKKIIDI